MLSTGVSTDCNTAVNYNEGCSIHAPTANSYGPAFNQNGGGIYVMERTSTASLCSRSSTPKPMLTSPFQFIKIWFFPRHSSTPLELALPSPIIETAVLGEPAAYYPNTQCDLDAKLTAHNIIFDITLCGDYAGNSAVYASSGCPGDCVAYVNQNASAFANAYWDVAALRVYQ